MAYSFRNASGSWTSCPAGKCGLSCVSNTNNKEAVVQYVSHHKDMIMCESDSERWEIL